MSSSGTKILVVEDENTVREGLVDNLALEGYEVIWRANGKSGVEAYEAEEPDLVILDLMMPEMDGFEVCKRIRSSERGTPIIMLTAKASEVDKVVGLELGADDYRRSAPVVAKVEPEKPAIPQELCFGSVEIDFKTYRAKKGDDEIVLSAKEFELIRYLSCRPDVPVTRDELLDNVWGYTNYPSTRTVDNFIARLRHKIEDVPDKPRYIVTVHGVGYKFVA